MSYNRNSGARFESRDSGVALEAGEFVHSAENDLLVKSTLNGQVPQFKADIYLENNQMIGCVKEVLGTVREVVCNRHYHFYPVFHS